MSHKEKQVISFSDKPTKGKTVKPNETITSKGSPPFTYRSRIHKSNYSLTAPLTGQIAQTVERVHSNRKVPSSNPG